MKIFIFLLLFSTILTACNTADNNNRKDEYAVIAYYHSADTLIDETGIQAQKLTHINYAFANILDGKITEGSKYDSLNFIKLNTLKTKNPDLKILISVGGWAWSGNFSDMALTDSSRSIFIKSCIKFINKYRLDGIDLDWEYPALPGNNNKHRPEDKTNFTALLKELRQALDNNTEKNKKKYLLTIAAGAFPDYVANVELKKIIQYLDFINLMTYDFTGGWNKETAHHTNLYIQDTINDKISVKKAVDSYLLNDVPTNKIVIGAAFYGRGWTGVNPDNNGLYQPAKSGLEFSYKDLVENYINKNNYISYFDTTAQAPYLWNLIDSVFITYENPQSIKAKCDYVKENQLLGIMFWQYTGDYKNELLNAISLN
ncbi:MAG: glycoside hydrolase family 18 protein [Bacteroidales bacterium]|nr:glycoside hydrolase family 18 protein [Bacteroidales bacterium]